MRRITESHIGRYNHVHLIDIISAPCLPTVIQFSSSSIRLLSKIELLYMLVSAIDDIFFHQLTFTHILYYFSSLLLQKKHIVYPILFALF